MKLPFVVWLATYDAKTPLSTRVLVWAESMDAADAAALELEAESLPWFDDRGQVAEWDDDFVTAAAGTTQLSVRDTQTYLREISAAAANLAAGLSDESGNANYDSLLAKLKEELLKAGVPIQ